MTKNAAEALRPQHEATQQTAEFNQQAHHAKPAENFHPQPEIGHNTEGCACAECQVTVEQANALAGELLDAGAESKDVCPPGCTCSAHEANSLADSLFRESRAPEAKKHTAHEHTKTEMDQQTANKIADEAHHDQKKEPHVCHVGCEHNQSKANEVADTLFGETHTEAEHSHQRNVVDEIHSRIAEPTTDRTPEADMEAQITEEYRRTLAGADTTDFDKTRVEVATDALDEVIETVITAKEAKVATQETRLETGAARQQPDQEPLRAALEKEVIAPQEYAAETVVIEQAATFSVEFAEANKTVLNEPVIGEAVHNDGKNLITDSLDPPLDITETTAIFEDALSLLNGSDIQLPAKAISGEPAFSPVVQSESVYHYEQTDSLTQQNEEIELSYLPETAQQIIGELATHIKAQDIPETIQALQEIINYIRHAIEHLGNYIVQPLDTVAVFEKLEVLAETLHIDTTALMELLEIATDGELVIDQQAYEILLGLKKSISMEYSFEFPQFTLTQSTNAVKSLTQTLGQFILVVLNRKLLYPSQSLAA